MVEAGTFYSMELQSELATPTGYKDYYVCSKRNVFNIRDLRGSRGFYIAIAVTKYLTVDTEKRFIQLRSFGD